MSNEVGTIFNQSSMEWNLSSSNICRLCGCTGEDHIDIYSDCGECMLLQEKITVSANVVIVKGDTLPKKVCVECCEKLDSIYEFQQFCLETQEKLSRGDLYNSKDILFENGNELAAEDLDTELLSDLTNDNSIITELREEAETFASVSSAEDLTGIENAILQGDVASEVTIEEQESLDVVPSEVETVPLEIEEDPNENNDGSAALGNTEMAEESEENNEPTVVRYLIISKPGSDGLDLKALPVINLRGSKKKQLCFHPLKSVSDADSSVDPSVNDITSIQAEETTEDKEKTAESLESVGKEKENIQKGNNSIVRVRVPQSSLVSKEVEKVSAREFKCRICEKTFRWKHQCEYHIREHLGEKQFHCICGKSFSTRHFLTRHEVSHDTLFLHLCQLCGKRFKTANQLLSHEKLHNNSRKYLCAVCGQTFRYKQSLTFHAVKHTGKYEHICEICGATFVRRHFLTVHINSHLGEMPHKCPTCGKGFTAKSNLTRHLLVHAAKKAKHNKRKRVKEVISE